MQLEKIEAGYFYADGGAMFGVVPKKVWQKRYPCNEDNGCKMSMRCLMIKTDNRLIIVDTGAGIKQLDYMKYMNFTGATNFEIELNKFGYSCSDVTDVILTHLHFDHCGDCTTYGNNKNEIVPTYPNATYWVSKKQWENYLKPNVREGNSYFRENMEPIMELGKLQLIENDQWLSDKIEMRLYDGHTWGQIAVYIHTPKQTLIFAGDVIPLMASIPLAWIASYDTYPVISMSEKDRMLKEANEKNQVLCFDHDAYTECCSVHEVNRRIKANKPMTLEEFKLENGLI